MDLNPLAISMYSVLLLLLTALSAPFLRRSQQLLSTTSFILAAVASAAVTAAGIWAVADGTVGQLVLPIGLPDLPFHLRLDALSGFFLTVVGLLSSFVSVYSIGYVRGFLGQRSVTSLVIFYCLFVAGMLMVVMADDALCFLVSWEMMATASYFLVMFERKTGGQLFSI